MSEITPPGERSCDVCGHLVEDHDCSRIAAECATLSRLRARPHNVREEYLTMNDYDNDTGA